MWSLTELRLLACLLMLWGVTGCGADDEGVPGKTGTQRDGGGDEYECVDEDGDGFGRYCSAGADCDDGNPEIKDECKRCKNAYTKGCPCESGRMPMSCDPPDVEVEGGVLVCSEGTRYCRDGLWSDCEIIGQYVFVKK